MEEYVQSQRLDRDKVMGILESHKMSKGSWGITTDFIPLERDGSKPIDEIADAICSLTV